MVVSFARRQNVKVIPLDVLISAIADVWSFLTRAVFRFSVMEASFCFPYVKVIIIRPATGFVSNLAVESGLF